jgi:signal transduction histidine kinase
LKKPFKFSLRTRIIVSFLIIAILSSYGIGYFTYNQARGTIENLVGQNALNVISSVVTQIDVDKFEKLQTEEDMDIEYYKELRDKLNAIRDSIGLKYLYTMRKTADGRYIYVVDGLPFGDEDESLLGDVEEESLTDVMLAAFDGKNGYELDDVTQKWGVLISAYVPIVDKNGKTIGILGSDFEAGYMIEQLNNIRKFIVFAIIFVFLVITFLQMRVIRKTVQLEKANCELENALDKLKQAQTHIVETEKMAALGGLVAGVAHEINTPLGIGVTAVSHLDQKTKEITEVFKSGNIKKSDFENYLNISQEATNIIMSNLGRASNLIKSFKQVAVDQSSEVRRIFNVKEYLDSIILSLAPELKKTKHKVIINCDESIEIDNYPGAFSQVVTNLLMNSLIHAYDEGDAGQIDFRITKEGKNLDIKYSDDGKGIPEDIIGEIFNPFFTTKRNKGGTGLGLNVVYNIVTQTFKGEIKCSSEVGKGTTFTITFPTKEGVNNE